MYEEYLGKDYHERIRKMLTLDEKVLPDSIIDADINIGGMKQLLSPALEKMIVNGKVVSSEKEFNQLSNAAVYYLCGILCMAMKSRTSVPPFDKKKYQKNWDKKQKKYIEKGNLIMQGLMKNV